MSDVFLNIKLHLFGWLTSHWSRWFHLFCLGQIWVFHILCSNFCEVSRCFLHSNSVCRNSFTPGPFEARLCCLSRFIKTMCQLWFRPGWRGYVDRLCTAAARFVSPCLSVFIACLVFRYLANVCRLVLGGFSRGGGDALRLMKVEQVDLFRSLWLKLCPVHKQTYCPR